MAQEPSVIESGLDGTAFRIRVNEAYASVASTYLGPTDPNEISGIVVEDGFQWIDNDADPYAWKVYLPAASGAVNGWITVMTFDAVTGEVAPGPDVQALLDAKLSLTGGTLTGKLTLDGNPSSNLHAATKQYVDSVSRPAPVRFRVAGLAEIQTNITQVLITESASLSAIHAWVDTAPTGSALTFTITRKRVSAGDEVRSASVLVGTNSKTEAITALSLLAGDRLQLSITAIGSTVAGGNDLLVTLPLQPPV